MAIGILGFVLTSTLALLPGNENFGSRGAAIAQEPNGSEAEQRIQTTETARAAFQKIANLEYDEIPFTEVMHDLEETLGHNIVLDQSAVDDSLTKDELIACRIRNVRLSDGLRLLLHGFNATYVIDNGIIRIISLDNLMDPEFHTTRMLDVKATLKLISANDPRTPQNTNTKPVSAERLLENAIANTVYPDLWKGNASGDAVLQTVGGILILHGPEFLLDEVANFVSNLHSKLASQVQ